VLCGLQQKAADSGKTLILSSKSLISLKKFLLKL